MSRPRWFYCKGWPWRVVRRPAEDYGGMERWIVYCGNGRSVVADIAPGEMTVAQRQEAAVRFAAQGVPQRPAPDRSAGAPTEAQA